ncbi:MAG: GerMN domain-containing protein [Lachnospiraceae bacterium]
MKRWCYAFLLALTVLLLSGCKAGGEKKGPADGVYQIYYMNASATKLVPVEYETTLPEEDRTNVDLLIQELMTQFITVPKDLDCQTTLSDKVEYRHFEREQMVVYLYFDSNYTSMKSYQEILCRAALAKTLTQIEGVDYITIYAGDQPILNQDGTPVGMLAGSDFIESVSNVNVFEKVELTLFFADETGEKLLQEKREVVHNVNSSLERLVVEELMKGTTLPGYYPTLPQDMKLLNVSVNENVCYLNFDSGFLNSGLEVKEYIPIYSIVNSLAALSTVNRVQFSVNGSQDVMFRDTISLNTLFERNLDYIEGEYN